MNFLFDSAEKIIIDIFLTLLKKRKKFVANDATIRCINYA